MGIKIYRVLRIAFVITLISIVAFSQSPEGLKKGDTAPLFRAEDQFGKQFDLKKELAKGPMVLFFYRGHWCKYCNRQLEELSDSLKYIVDAGANIVAVTPEVMEFVDETSKQYEGAFRIISDTEMKIMKSYRVNFTLDEATAKRYDSKGIKLDLFNGTNGTNLPVPATYIISTSGKIDYVYFDPNYRNRVSVSEIVRQLHQTSAVN